MHNKKQPESHEVSDSRPENRQPLDREAYLDRIGASSSWFRRPDLQTLERLQEAHVRTIPFETLSITGDPYSGWEGSPISLSIPDIYTKIVDDHRGGFCYELNGLFSWLLADLGFDVRRVSARIKTDGQFGPPADHLTLVVDLDEPYLVDVGFGIPKLRQPLPLEGPSHVDDAGMSWRITETERPDADYAVEYRPPDTGEWDTRCIFRDVPRAMDYFQATCEHFERAPDSHFTGEPIITIATERGHSKLSPTTITRSTRDNCDEQAIDPSEWYDLLAQEFGLSCPPEATVANRQESGLPSEQ